MALPGDLPPLPRIAPGCGAARRDGCAQDRQSRPVARVLRPRGASLCASSRFERFVFSRFHIIFIGPLVNFQSWRVLPVCSPPHVVIGRTEAPRQAPQPGSGNTDPGGILHGPDKTHAAARLVAGRQPGRSGVGGTYRRTSRPGSRQAVTGSIPVRPERSCILVCLAASGDCQPIPCGLVGAAWGTRECRPCRLAHDPAVMIRS